MRGNMDGFEFLIFIFTTFYTILCISSWYRRLIDSRHPKNTTARFVLALLPIITFFIVLYTLRELASFDVVDDSIYILLYILIGYTLVFFGLKLVFCFFDLSWIDDALNNNNKAALFAITGAFLGLVVIYSGANIGDGPGWWCVIFAGGLGLISWILLGVLINKYTQVFERITVERDMYCGIRFGLYLLASGIILGRASAGDWTSFFMTVVEFLVGWPVLLLALLVVLIERAYINKAKMRENVNNYLYSSIYCGIIYILIAIVCVVIFPLPENPVYGSISTGFLGVVL